MSGKSLVLLGLLGTFGIGLAMIMIGLGQGLPGHEPEFYFSNRHPLLWTAMSVAFWISVVAMLAGLAMVWLERYDDTQDSSGGAK